MVVLFLSVMSKCLWCHTDNVNIRVSSCVFELPNIFVDQGQFSDPDFIIGTHQRKKFQFADKYIITADMKVDRHHCLYHSVMIFSITVSWLILIKISLCEINEIFVQITDKIYLHHMEAVCTSTHSNIFVVDEFF